MSWTDCPHDKDECEKLRADLADERDLTKALRPALKTALADLAARDARIALLERTADDCATELEAANARVAELEAMFKRSNEHRHEALRDKRLSVRAANARADAELKRAEDWIEIAQDHMQQRDAANARADAAEKSEREWKHWRETAVKACDRAEEALTAERAKTARLAAVQLKRDQVYDERPDELRARLAAATELLEYVYDQFDNEESLSEDTLRRITAFLAAQPAPAKDALR